MRPDFITEEQLNKWKLELDNDLNIPEIIKNDPIIREVCYASLFLSDELRKIYCTEVKIMQLQTTAGTLSFGRDPWDVVLLLLDKYKKNEIDFPPDDLSS